MGVLAKMGFSGKWRSLISNLIQNCWFSLLINGECTGFFKSSKGIRQGDPLSPSLFILASEFFSRGINKLFEEYTSLNFHANCSLQLSHLAYADDLIVFLNGASSSVRRVMSFIQEYERISGQIINKDKSCMIFGKNVKREARNSALRISGCGAGVLPLPFLGGMLHKGKPKARMFDPIIARLTNKMTSWENIFLSAGGRLVLIKSVLATIPLYVLQLMSPPSSIIKRIEGLLNKFLWGSNNESKRTHWTSWNEICFPSKEGGLGLRSIRDWNLIFSMKSWVQFRLQVSLWSKFLKAKYCKGQHPSLIAKRPYYSSSWNRLLDGRFAAEPFIKWSIGQGDISFLHDSWSSYGKLAELECCQNFVGDPPVKYFLHPPCVSNLNADSSLVGGNPNAASTSSSHLPAVRFAGNNSGFPRDCWNAARLAEWLPEDMVFDIIQTKISEGNDHLIWESNSSSTFSCNDAWNKVRLRKPENGIWDNCWNNRFPISVSLFTWRIIHNFIPVDARMQAFGISLASRCQCCGNIEDLNHVFIQNPIAVEVWNKVKSWFSVQEIRDGNVFSLLASWRQSHTLVNRGHIRTLIPMITLKELWMARNDAKHNGKKLEAKKIILNIERKITLLCKGRLILESNCIGDAMFRNLFQVESKGRKESRPKVFAWPPPEEGWLKLNTDGCSKGNPGEAAGGGLLRDHKGRLISAFFRYLGIQTSFMAEMLALNLGIDKCVELNASKVWIELDSIALCWMLNSNSTPQWRHLHTILDIRKKLRNIEWKCSHIWREGNSAADLLANLGLSAPPCSSWSDITPHHKLNGIIRLDQQGVKYIRR